MVTGGAKRIGANICQFFAKNGYNIAIHCNNSINEAEKLTQEITSHHKIECKIFQGNLQNPSEALHCIKNAIKHFGQIDVLVNNASFFEESSFSQTSLENLTANFNVHYLSPFVLMQEFAKQQHLNEGLIVNILDCNINRNTTKHFSYLQSKKALLALTQHLACTLAPKIRTNAISPGFIIPEENTIISEEYISNKMKQIPLKKQGSVEEIIHAVEYLLNSKYINGQNIYVDGGTNLLTL